MYHIDIIHYFTMLFIDTSLYLCITLILFIFSLLFIDTKLKNNNSAYHLPHCPLHKNSPLSLWIMELMELLKKLFKEEKIFPLLFAIAISNVAVLVAKGVALQVRFRIVLHSSCFPCSMEIISDRPCFTLLTCKNQTSQNVGTFTKLYS